jgi:hypothetical protein
MNHKVGDTVQIRSKEWIDAQEKDDDGDIYKEEIDIQYFVKDYFRYAGMTARIIVVDDEVFRIDIDDGYDYWAEWMFEPDYNPADEPLPAEDAVIAMVREKQTLIDKEGGEYYWGKYEGAPEKDIGFVYRYNGVEGINYSCFTCLYRHPEKRKRLMTKSEARAWAESDASLGWMVKGKMINAWKFPRNFEYGNDMDGYRRARLLPGLSGIDESTIQGFEVEE